MTETIEPVPGLKNLRREQAPLNDLWPGIEARLKPRRRYAPWAGLAIAASLLLAVILPLRMQTDSSELSSPAVSGNDSRHITYFAAQLKIVHGAEKELLHALKQRPHSPALHRLLESTRQRQRELHRLITIHA